MKMKKYLLFYNFVITAVLGISTFTSAQSQSDYLLAAFFVPLPLYFGNRLFKFAVLNAKRLRYRPKQRFAAAASASSDVQVRLIDDSPGVEPSSLAEGGVVVGGPRIKDVDRRLFLRLIAGSGVSLFLLSIFTKDAHAAFFGSVPGPGTVAVKDSIGNLIDPAEKQPTDGYEIAQLDDTGVTFAYYGFLNKNSNWYIMREDLVAAPGTYLYAAGLTSFATNWTGRAALSYTTFDLAF